MSALLPEVHGGLAIVDLQDRIVAKVQKEFPNHTVYQDSIPDDEHLPFDATGKLQPYIVLRFGPLRPGYTGKSIRGPRYDEYWASCDLIAISSNGRVSRVLNAALVSKMMGFRPDGVAPMQMRTDAGDPAQFVVSSNESRPTQYVSTTRLRYTVNGTNTGADIPTPAP